jgi:uncharacterized protein YbgA (DUF1722 family)/uncharacterized protein YbbK (DUF523 family)
LLGEPVRYNGGHKRDDVLTGVLGPFVEWVQVCPEDEAGLGTPREPMNLVRTGTGIRVLTVQTRRDVTDQLRNYAQCRSAELLRLDLDGFVLKSGSPSCGVTGVNVYPENGPAERSGQGLFAHAISSADPLLPMEEEGRIHDPAIRENFIDRAFAHRRLRRLLSSSPRVADLVAFHTAHKLLLLAHSPDAYRQLGRLVASVRADVFADNLLAYGRGFASAFATVATTARHVNVLQHAAGCLTDRIAAETRHELARTIADYQDGLVPLIVPVRLIAHHASLHRITYLEGQYYFDLDLRELSLPSGA